MGGSALPDLHAIHEILHGRGRANLPEARPTRVCIDSRNCVPGSLFVALPGEQTDGHRFVADAAAAGAVGAIVRAEVDPDGAPWPLPTVVVDDGLVALQRLAAWYCETALTGVTRIGVTGSNGKTTTKEILAAMLSRHGHCFASAGNLNSETGLPLSVLATPPEADFAVYEMAMSNPGEMAPLARIVRPAHAVITNIGTAHIGQLGSRSAIAREKRDIAAAFTGTETLYVPEDDDFRDELAKGVRGEVVFTGPRHAGARITPTDEGVALELDGARGVLPLPGVHNGRNALAALTVVRRLGMAVEPALGALSDVRVPEGRSQVIRRGALTVIHDAYNANPDSMAAAITMVKNEPGLILVLGDMLELGDYEDEGHQSAIRAALSSRATQVYLIGERFARAAGFFAASDRCVTATSPDEIIGALGAIVERDPGPVTVLVKGSRAMKLERIADALVKEDVYRV